MSSRQTVIEHNGRTYYGTVGVIDRTTLGVHEHHGCFVAELALNYGGGGQSASVIIDGKAAEPGGDRDPQYIGPFIRAILDTVGVDQWEQLKGRSIFAIRGEPGFFAGFIIGIANLQDEDKVLVFEDFFKGEQE